VSVSQYEPVLYEAWLLPEYFYAFIVDFFEDFLSLFRREVDAPFLDRTTQITKKNNTLQKLLASSRI
jgi:hypothetical protein